MLLDAEDAHARGRQLDRERDAIEVVADLGDRRSVGGVDGEVRPHLQRPLDEQAHGSDWATACTGSVRRSEGSDSEGTRQSVSPATPSGARLVASTVTSRAAAQQDLSRSCTGLEQVLTVVQNDQRLRVGEVGDRASSEDWPGSGLTPDRLAERRADGVGVGQRRQLDPPGAVGEAVQRVGGGLGGEPCLAATPGAGQRQQPRGAQRLATSLSSRSRPTKLVSCSGRLFGSASSERNGSELAGKSGWLSANTCSGRPRSRSRCIPRSTSATPSGSRSTTRS